MSSQKTDQASFHRDVVEQPGVVLVEFGARWCPPCRAMAPVMERVAERGLAKVVEVDSDENPALSNRYGVRALPTFLVFKGGNVVKSFVGAQSFETLEAAVAS